MSDKSESTIEHDESQSSDESDEESEELAAKSAAALAAQGRRNWDKSFKALERYKKRYGNCLVPSAYDDDTALGHWVRKQRRNEANGTLSASRKKKLDKLGFVWKLRGDQYAGQGSNPGPPCIRARRAAGKRSWIKSFEALKNYAKKNGHCNVPRRYPPDLALGQWVSKQRIQKEKLSKQQRQKLQSIGFTWSIMKQKSNPKKSWKSQLDLLKAYKKKHGDCNVPPDYEDDLGNWVAEQRKAYLDNKLTSDRVAQLDALGFIEDKDEDSESDEEHDDNNDNDDNDDEESGEKKKKKSPRPKVTLAERWETNYEILVRFYKSHGHCIVPRTKEKTLSYWVQRQRMLNLTDKLKQYRKDMLDDLNFEWYHGFKLPENYFDEMIGRLIAFKEAEGHVDVPRRYKRGGLGEWVEEMKRKGRDGLLEPEEAERLLRVGFTWMEDREGWLRQYEECAYELKTCRHYETVVELSSENENWLQVQFLLLDYDMLPSKRREKLESLGVEWDGKEFSWEERGMYDGGGADNGIYDDEISTGFDLKGAAMAWTPDGKSGSSATETERDAASAVPPVSSNAPLTPDKKKDGGKEVAKTEKPSKEDKDSEEVPAALTSAAVVEPDEAPSVTVEGKKRELTDGTSDKDNDPPQKKAKTEASGDK